MLEEGDNFGDQAKASIFGVKYLSNTLLFRLAILSENHLNTWKNPQLFLSIRTNFKLLFQRVTETKPFQKFCVKSMENATYSIS